VSSDPAAQTAPAITIALAALMDIATLGLEASARLVAERSNNPNAQAKMARATRSARNPSTLPRQKSNLPPRMLQSPRQSLQTILRLEYPLRDRVRW